MSDALDPLPLLKYLDEKEVEHIIVTDGSDATG
jgi:hypothetical protein